MISFSNISKSYVGSYKSVDNLNLEINDGEIFGILGPNGAGKTTTLKMLTGILSPSEGSISINGFDISKNPLKAKRQFGYVPDNPDMFLRLTGIEYLNFLGDAYDVPKDERIQRIKNLSEKFSMNHALGDKIQTYSHGMRQKIVIMGALIHNPKVWILDEPLTGLDPKSSFLLKDMMRQHADEGNIVLFSTHVLEVAEKVCDKVGIINKGKLIFNGSLSEMRTEFAANESLESMFLEMTEDAE